MITKIMGRAGWHHATPKTSKSTCNCNVNALHLKAFIVTLAFWGWLPIELADRVIHQGELRDE